MINPDFEIDRLRWRLSDKGWEPHEIDQICDLASEDINNIILDVVSNATAEAVDFAQSIGADAFIDDMDIVESGHMFQIRTRSGRTDYSRDRQEMLPNLLKNAKTSQDGSRYKVIPIRDKQKVQMGASMFDSLNELKKAQEIARANLLDNNRNNRSARANQMADQFRQSMRQSMTSKRKTIESSGEVTFRTASSKQSADNSWVIPEKDADMTQYLVDLNSRMLDTIEQSVVLILKSYEKEYG